MIQTKINAFAWRRYLPSPVAVLALLLGLTVTWVAWRTAGHEERRDAQTLFEERVSDVRNAVKEQMNAYDQVLRGAAGFYYGAQSISRQEWRAYVESLQIERNYPGIQALGFIQYVPAAEKSRHVLAVRAEGFADYAISPRGARADYAPGVYIEPFSGRNLRAFGFDAMSDEVRRAALAQARDSGELISTGKVTLVQESGDDIQVGFLTYLPVYRHGAERDTPAQRRAALVGYFHSTFRMNDLMRGVLRDERRDVSLSIYDAVTQEKISPQALMYDQIAAEQPERSAARASARVSQDGLFNSIERMDIGGRHWVLKFSSTPAFDAMLDHQYPQLILLSGLLVSLLFFGLVQSQATTRQRAQAMAHGMTLELAKLNERLNLALEGASAALWDSDLITGEVYLSKMWSVMLGDADVSDEMRGTIAEPTETRTTVQGLLALVHPDEREFIFKQSQDTMKGIIPEYKVDHRVMTRSGEWKWIHSRGKVVERDSLTGKALRMSGTNIDISERKLVDRMKTEFISVVSHELRTPLTSILGSLGLVAGGVAGPLTEQGKTLIEMARSNSERLMRLINDILDIEKIESGEMSFNPSPLNLGVLMRQSVEANLGYAEAMKVHFEFSPDTGTGDINVLADPDRLMQVMANLLSNAAKFSPAGGRVVIRQTLMQNRVRVSVADCGTGIPDEFRERIFGKFAQADSSDTRQIGGTGLGLSICKAIVEKSGGHIGFDSEVGKGATFWFELPVL